MPQNPPTFANLQIVDHQDLNALIDAMIFPERPQRFGQICAYQGSLYGYAGGVNVVDLISRLGTAQVRAPSHPARFGYTIPGI